MIIKEKILMIFLIILLSSTQIILPLRMHTGKRRQMLQKTIQTSSTKQENSTWQIEIPKINLKAPIKEGTDQETLNQYVGHFKESQYIKGNICLAAHNRGYKVNYFEKIKELKIGDEIIYELKKVKLTYKVTENKIIKDTNVEILENTKENIITLITCVENQPEKRRCIKGKLTI